MPMKTNWCLDMLAVERYDALKVSSFQSGDKWCCRMTTLSLGKYLCGIGDGTHVPRFEFGSMGSKILAFFFHLWDILKYKLFGVIFGG